MNLRLKKTGMLAVGLLSTSTLLVVFQNFSYGTHPVIGAYEDGNSGYIAGQGATKEQNLEALESYLGVPAYSMYGFDYFNQSSDFNAMVNSAQWAVPAWAGQNSNREMIWSVPLSVSNYPSLADVANGM